MHWRKKSNKEDEKPWEMTTRVLLKNVQSLRDCLDGCAAKGKEEITSFDVLRGLLNDSDKSLFQVFWIQKKSLHFPFCKNCSFASLAFWNFPKFWGCPFSTDLNWYLTKTVIIDPKIDFFPLLSNFSLYQTTCKTYFTVASTHFFNF